MTPTAQRLLNSIQAVGRRRTLRWHMHHAPFTADAVTLAARELESDGLVHVDDSEAIGIGRVLEPITDDTR